MSLLYGKYKLKLSIWLGGVGLELLFCFVFVCFILQKMFYSGKNLAQFSICP